MYMYKKQRDSKQDGSDTASSSFKAALRIIIIILLFPPPLAFTYLFSPYPCTPNSLDSMSDNHKRKERQGSTTGSSTERYLGGSVAIDQDPSRGKRRGLHGLKVLTTLYGVEKKSESYELRVPQPDGTVRKLPACHGLSIGGLAECGDEELQERIPDKIDVGMRAIVRGRGDNFAIVHALAFLPSLRSDGLGGGKMPRVLFGHVDDKGNDENKLYQAAVSSFYY